MKYLDIKQLVNVREVEREGYDFDTCFQCEICVGNDEIVSEFVHIEYRAKLDGVRLDLVIVVYVEGVIWDELSLSGDTGREFLLKLRELNNRNEKRRREARIKRSEQIREKLS